MKYNNLLPVEYEQRVLLAIARGQRVVVISRGTFHYYVSGRGRHGDGDGGDGDGRRRGAAPRSSGEGVLQQVVLPGIQPGVLRGVGGAHPGRVEQTQGGGSTPDGKLFHRVACYSDRVGETIIQGTKKQIFPMILLIHQSTTPCSVILP